MNQYAKLVANAAPVTPNLKLNINKQFNKMFINNPQSFNKIILLILILTIDLKNQSYY